MNAEMFARGDSNIQTLLALLQDQADFYIRYYTVQLLTALAHTSSHRVTQARCCRTFLEHVTMSLRWHLLQG